jgi:hypothetical protein
LGGGGFDVCCVTDVVLDRRSETDKYDAVERMWKETWAPVYKRRAGALIKSAIRKWNKSVKATVVVISTRRFSVEVRTILYTDGLILV